MVCNWKFGQLLDWLETVPSSLNDERCLVTTWTVVRSSRMGFWYRYLTNGAAFHYRSNSPQTRRRPPPPSTTQPNKENFPNVWRHLIISRCMYLRRAYASHPHPPFLFYPQPHRQGLCVILYPIRGAREGRVTHGNSAPLFPNVFFFLFSCFLKKKLFTD